MLAPPLLLLALLLLGFAAWSFLEYVIHGWLSHTFATPVAPLHWTHHRDPRRVFTSLLVWGPTSVAIWGLFARLAGTTPAAALVLGILAGFQRYDYVHWRIHFGAPRNAHQERLRAHHLAHHFRNPNAYYGVTTRLWDGLFGTLPAHHREDDVRSAHRVALGGASNFGSVWPRRTESGAR